jgi:sulfopyruvate decarboxylase TPP-binding subunit
MFEGSAVVAVLRQLGISHVIWIPDSELGKWESSFDATQPPCLLRVTREAEAFGIAAGLIICGRRPLVIIQCTGLFDAGDALRNVVHDLKLPVVAIIGARGQLAYWRGQSSDTCPQFTEPIIQAWKIPYSVLSVEEGITGFQRELSAAFRESKPRLLILPE